MILSSTIDGMAFALLLPAFFHRRPALHKHSSRRVSRVLNTPVPTIAVVSAFPGRSGFDTDRLHGDNAHTNLTAFHAPSIGVRSVTSVPEPLAETENGDR